MTPDQQNVSASSRKSDQLLAEIIDAYRSGEAERLQTALESASEWMKPERRGRPAKLNIHRVRELAADGLGPTAIARELGSTTKTVWAAMARHKIKVRI